MVMNRDKGCMAKHSSARCAQWKVHRKVCRGGDALCRCTLVWLGNLPHHRIVNNGAGRALVPPARQHPWRTSSTGLKSVPGELLNATSTDYNAVTGSHYHAEQH